MMNKKLLPLAVLTAVATGGLSTAQAVHVNSDGTGEVLIYPYYSVEGGLDTYITVVNTTDEVKAVKVRFLEGMNSQEVLDFNLYLSPRDHWAATVTASGAGDDAAAMIRTADTSCTVPSVPTDNVTGIEFRDLQYAGDHVNGPARTREGYVEIIEMGTVTGDLATAATHTSNGVPADCGALLDAWSTGGTWVTTQGDEGIGDATGGLYGYGQLISPTGGVTGIYNATALDNFWGGGSDHTAPETVFPSLGSGTSDAVVIDGANIFMAEAGSGIDAVSATLMHSSIMNDYVTDASINAGTDWVVNFPTKRFYVNDGESGGGEFTSDDLAPFTTAWDSDNSQACEEISINYWDREEQTEFVRDIDFSPTPGDDPIALCKEVNVLSINGSDVLHASDRLGHNLDLAFDNGWMEIDFTGAGRELITFDGATEGETDLRFNGLPTIGFAAIRYTNQGMDVGGETMLSNYMGLINHTMSRSIDSGEIFD